MALATQRCLHLQAEGLGLPDLQFSDTRRLFGHRNQVSEALRKPPSYHGMGMSEDFWKLEPQGTGFSCFRRKIPWRRKRQPTTVFLPGKSHGQRSLWAPSPLSSCTGFPLVWNPLTHQSSPFPLISCSLQRQLNPFLLQTSPLRLASSTCPYIQHIIS